MCIEVIVCNVIVVFLRHSVYISRCGCCAVVLCIEVARVLEEDNFTTYPCSRYA